LNPVQQDNPITKLDFYKIWQINNNLKNINLENKNEFLLFLNKLLLINDKLNGFGYNDYAKYNYTKNDCELLPFPTNIGTVNRSLGISVNCKILLLSYAMSQPTTPLILGGDFSKSMFGDPELSTAVFTYINSHPWIQVISINDLINSRALLSSGPLPYQESTPYTSVNQQNTNISGKPNTTKIQNMVHDALLQSPNNQLTALAWKVFIDLTQSASQQLWALKANYVGQIGLILTAAKWVENPGLKIACNTDLDYDGKNECILANDTIIAIIEPDGGYIPFVFAKDAQGIHQIIGPTWEFVVGLSDPSSWNPDLGIRGDSAQMLGAFQDTSDNWNSYNVDLLKGKLEMYGNNIGMHKSIAIYPNRLHVDILNQNKSHSISYIPMVIDPWFRYTLGWGDYYFSKNEPFIIQWGITSGEKVDILATNPIKVFSFNDSRSALAYPEDPNYDYSQGHYLPYPMSVANLITTENYSVDIIINP
jgi:hypothetical protein